MSYDCSSLEFFLIAEIESIKPKKPIPNINPKNISVIRCESNNKRQCILNNIMNISKGILLFIIFIFFTHFKIDYSMKIML